MNETQWREGLNRSRTSMRRMRWALVGLSALLAVVLIASGAVIIGAIVAVIVVVRTIMILQYQPGGARIRRGR